MSLIFSYYIIFPGYAMFVIHVRCGVVLTEGRGGGILGRVIHVRSLTYENFRPRIELISLIDKITNIFLLRNF